MLQAFCEFPSRVEIKRTGTVALFGVRLCWNRAFTPENSGGR
jgi:hypothetical protein